jgi:sugar phosphate permease
MNDVAPEDSGLASGLVNTSFMMGGALGLAVLASIAASGADGSTAPAALLDGYHAAFLVGALLAGLAAVIGGVGLRGRPAAGCGETEGTWDLTLEPEAQGAA